MSLTGQLVFSIPFKFLMVRVLVVASHFSSRSVQMSLFTSGIALCCSLDLFQDNVVLVPPNLIASQHKLVEAVKRTEKLPERNCCGQVSSFWREDLSHGGNTEHIWDRA